MYDVNKLFSGLVQLGEWLREEAASDGQTLRTAEAQNGWFTPESVAQACQAHGEALRAKNSTAGAASTRGTTARRACPWG